MLALIPPCVDEVVALASSRSIGSEVSFGGATILRMQDLRLYAFKGIDYVLLSTPPKVSAAFDAARDQDERHRDRQLRRNSTMDNDDAAGGVRGQAFALSEVSASTSSPTPTARPSRWWWR